MVHFIKSALITALFVAPTLAIPIHRGAEQFASPRELQLEARDDRLDQSRVMRRELEEAELFPRKNRNRKNQGPYPPPTALQHPGSPVQDVPSTHATYVPTHQIHPDRANDIINHSLGPGDAHLASYIHVAELSRNQRKKVKRLYNTGNHAGVAAYFQGHMERYGPEVGFSPDPPTRKTRKIPDRARDMIRHSLGPGDARLASYIGEANLSRNQRKKVRRLYNTGNDAGIADYFQGHMERHGSEVGYHTQAGTYGPQMDERELVADELIQRQVSQRLAPSYSRRGLIPFEDALYEARAVNAINALD